MKITINSLTLNYFKGFKSKKVTFHNPETVISGKNKSGKSTIADAFTWLLFGKDMFNRSDFEVKTIKDGEVVPRVDHVVEGELHIGGKSVTIRRTLREKWQKKTGEFQETFIGNETLYDVNNVPYSQTDYKKFIDELIPESRFKLLSNPLFFNSLKWQERRAMLQEIATIPSLEEVAGKEFKIIYDEIVKSGKSFEMFLKEIAAEKKRLNERLADIPPRIDELKTTTPAELDWNQIQSEIVRIEKLLKELDAGTHDLQQQIEKRRALIKQKEAVQEQIASMESNARFYTNAAMQDIEQQLKQKSKAIETAKYRIDGLTSQLKSNKELLISAKEEIEKLRAEFVNINKQSFTEDDIDTHCPTCQQELPAETIESKKRLLVENFNKKKAETLDNINKIGLSLKEKITMYEAEIKRIESELETDSSITKLNKEYNELEKKLSDFDAVEYVNSMLSANKEYADLKTKLSKMDIPEIGGTAENDNSGQKAKLNQELDELKLQLSNKGRIDEINQRIEHLLKEETEYAQQLADNERKEFNIKGLQSKLMQSVEDSVNGLFKGTPVSFKLFETLINGSVADTCITLVDGIPFPDANNAGQINAGLAIIDVFGKYYDTRVPIFIDNAEGVNDLYKVDTQMINMYVTTTDLQISNNKQNDKTNSNTTAGTLF